MSQATDSLSPLHVFQFVVKVQTMSADPSARPPNGPGGETLCGGAFSECSGLEATMEPAVIREGGRNYGDVQRPGRVTFGTVVLKRGITTNKDLWKWWALVNGGRYGHRLRVTIELLDAATRVPTSSRASSGGSSTPARGRSVQPSWRWLLRRCLPVKMKAPDLNAMGADVGIEELHLVHEGLIVVDQNDREVQ